MLVAYVALRIGASSIGVDQTSETENKDKRVLPSNWIIKVLWHSEGLGETNS